MTGLVPVIPANASAFGDVVKPPEKRLIGRKRSRVDGRDEPDHDGILFENNRGGTSASLPAAGVELASASGIG